MSHILSNHLRQIKIAIMEALNSSPIRMDPHSPKSYTHLTKYLLKITQNVAIYSIKSKKGNNERFEKECEQSLQMRCATS